MISKNKKIVHLDLSNNFLDRADFSIISKALELNKTIYGFHYEGNYG